MEIYVIQNNLFAYLDQFYLGQQFQSVFKILFFVESTTNLQKLLPKILNIKKQSNKRIIIRIEMGNICYAEQNTQNDAPRDFPFLQDISFSNLNRKVCDHCEFFKSLNFKFALKLINIEGFDDKMKQLAKQPISKRHQQLKIQEQISFLPECDNETFNEIKSFNSVLSQPFSQPQVFLVKSITLDVTTSQFQRFLSCPRKKTYYEQQKTNQFLYHNRTIKDLELSDAEQLLVFYLRWGVSFENFKFITNDQIKHDYLRFIYDNFKYMFHLALTLNIFINEHPKEDEFLKIYAIIYEQYNILMWQMQQEYEFCGDGLMEMYHKYFEQGNQMPATPEDRMPHFTLISIYQRYWCQRVMESIYTPNYKKKIRKLIESFNKMIDQLRQKELRDISDSELKLLRRVFSSILDCSVNEISIHWVGHSKFDCANEYLGEFILELNIKTKEYYQEKYNNLNLNDYSDFVDQDLYLMKLIFPEWIISNFIEGIGILKKRDKLNEYFLLNYGDQIKNIKSSEEVNKELIEAVKQEADMQLANQKNKQDKQQQPDMIKLSQSEDFSKFILQRISQIKKINKIEKTALFLDSLSRIQINKYDIAQLSTTQKIQKPIADQTTGANDTKFNLNDIIINDLYYPSQESLAVAHELERTNENIIQYIDNLDSQQKENNYQKFIRDKQVENYVAGLGVSTERRLDKLSFKKNQEFFNFKNIQESKWVEIKKLLEQKYYQDIIQKLEIAIQNQDPTIKNKQTKLEKAKGELNKIKSKK
ncbi:hypothetical protein pb186bvf_006870 [Paramecium bursaria]